MFTRLLYLSIHTAPATGPRGTRRRDCALARSRRQRASQALAYSLRAASAHSPAPPSLVPRWLRTADRQTFGDRVTQSSIANGVRSQQVSQWNLLVVLADGEANDDRSSQRGEIFGQRCAAFLNPRCRLSASIVLGRSNSLLARADVKLLSKQAEPLHTTAAELANEPSESVH